MLADRILKCRAVCMSEDTEKRYPPNSYLSTTAKLRKIVVGVLNSICRQTDFVRAQFGDK